MSATELQPSATKPCARRTHHSLHIDMTPLADLGFLLISFFIFTTSISAPHTMPLIMPRSGPATEVKESRSLTFLLGGNDRVMAYEGRLPEKGRADRIHTSDYDVKTGLGQVVRDKKKRLGAAKDSLVVLIKASERSSYKNLVDALDEMVINQVQFYMLAEMETWEKNYLKEDQ